MHPRLAGDGAAGKAAGCTVGFSTNGVLLGPQALSDLLAARLDWIAFSIDAAEPATYAAIRQGASLDVVLQNVARVVAAGRGAPSVSFFFVMMRQNVHELPALIRLAHELGVRQVVAKNLDVVLKEGDEALALIEGDGVPPAQAAQVARPGPRGGRSTARPLSSLQPGGAGGGRLRAGPAQDCLCQLGGMGLAMHHPVLRPAELVGRRSGSRWSDSGGAMSTPAPCLTSWHRRRPANSCPSIVRASAPGWRAPSRRRDRTTTNRPICRRRPRRAAAAATCTACDRTRRKIG